MRTTFCYKNKSTHLSNMKLCSHKTRTLNTSQNTLLHFNLHRTLYQRPKGHAVNCCTREPVRTDHEDVDKLVQVSIVWPVMRVVVYLISPDRHLLNQPQHHHHVQRTGPSKGTCWVIRCSHGYPYIQEILTSHSVCDYSSGR